MPDCPFTLQSGISTAALGPDWLYTFSDDKNDDWRVFRMMLHARGVNGSVSVMSGFADAAERLSEAEATPLVQNVRSMGGGGIGFGSP